MISNIVSLYNPDLNIPVGMPAFIAVLSSGLVTHRCLNRNQIFRSSLIHIVSNLSCIQVRVWYYSAFSEDLWNVLTCKLRFGSSSPLSRVEITTVNGNIMYLSIVGMNEILTYTFYIPHI